ncbi:MAG: formyltransferase family protein, partial [Dehalococcoidia bacterium]
DYDQAILHLIEPFGTDIAILAGYMLIAPELCRRMTLLNLHPAAPGGPAGIWQDVIWQLIEQRAESSGVTIFRATPDLDAGPALSFCTYSLHDTALDPLWRMLAGRPIAGLPEREGEKLPLFREIRRRGSIREAPLLVQTLAAIASGQISHEVHGPGFEASSLPLDLSDQVDRSLTADL